MNSIFGITNIMVKMFLLQTASGDNALAELNRFLDEYNGNIISIDYQAQTPEQVAVFVTHRAFE